MAAAAGDEIPREHPAAGQDVATLSVYQFSEKMASAVKKIMDSSLEIHEITEMLASLADQFEAKNRRVQELETKNYALELSIARIHEAQEGGNKELQAATIKHERASHEIVKLVMHQLREKEAALARMQEMHVKHQLELEQVVKLSHTLQETTQFDREDKCVEELRDARKALIEGFRQCNLITLDSSVIAIKMMGELDEKPFRDAWRRKYGNESGARTLLSLWQDDVNNPSWLPFKTLEVDGKIQQVVDEDDPKLRRLRIKHGDKVWNAVKVAIAELQEYNPSGRYPVPELWNFSKGRKATMVEALNCFIKG